MATKAKAPTPLALFRQQARISQLREKLWDEERKLAGMAEKTSYRDEMLVVDGTVYKLSTKRYYSDPMLKIEKVGLASDLASLVCS